MSAVCKRREVVSFKETLLDGDIRECTPVLVPHLMDDGRRNMSLPLISEADGMLEM